MPKIAYIKKRFHKKSLIKIKHAVDIIEEYERQGYSLTLRQLYYQFVARDLIPNKQREYNKLGNVINDARMAGYIDWNSIEDRTRYIRKNSHFDDPTDLLDSASRQYKIDMWQNQSHRVEVCIEKDALIGVIERVCNKWDVTFLSCRGYVSQSEMWNSAQRLTRYHYMDDRKVIVLHLGDHDPSDIDMTRDIVLRLNSLAVEPRYRGDSPEEQDRWVDPEWTDFNREYLWPIRIALSMGQIRELNPPPNPAKMSDSWFQSYLTEYGTKSWELDALEPEFISNLIEEHILQYLDGEKWNEMKQRHESEKSILTDISDHYEDVEQLIENIRDDKADPEG